MHGDNKTLNDLKDRTYTCPKCGGQIRWSCGYTGKGYAHCENSSTVTRVFELDTIHTMKFCDWHGHCERRPDGKVEIYYYEPI